MIENCISKNVMDSLFLNHSAKVTVTLRSSIDEGDNFDPFRNIAFVKTDQNPLFIKAIIRSLAPNSLIIKSMGLTETGAKWLLVKEADVALVKLSKILTINEEEYYIYNDRIGNKLQIFSLRFGYSKILIFRKDT